MLWPNGSTVRPPISSNFGPREGGGGASTNHMGTDYIGFSTIRAVADGTVLGVGVLPGWSGGGTQVYIQHDGFTSRSLHMVEGSPVVRVGQRVSEGEALGTMGRTGTATGVHLHLEIAVGGRQVDSVPFITSRLSGAGRPAGAGKDDDMPLNDDDKNWIREAIRQELGGALSTAAFRDLTEDDKVWVREAVRQELGGAIKQLRPGS